MSSFMTATISEQFSEVELRTPYREADIDSQPNRSQILPAKKRLTTWDK